MDIGRRYDDEMDIIIPDDCFTCGMGLYASLYYGDRGDLLVFEIVNLDAQKLGKGLEDYCFLAVNDMVASMKAEQRRKQGLADADALQSARTNDMRPLWEIEENKLGGRVLENPAARSGLYYHEKG